MLTKPHKLLRDKRRPLQMGKSVSEKLVGLVAGLDSASALIVIGGALMGRATVLGTLWPFSQAYYAAAAFFLPRHAGLVALSLIAGAATTRVLGRTIITGLNVFLLSSVLNGVRSKPGTAGQKLAVLAGALGFVSTSVVHALSQAEPYAYLLAGVEAITAMGLTLAFSQALPLISEPAKRLDHEEVASLCILAACAVAGVAEIRIGQLELRNVVASFLTMSMAATGGAAIGAAAGASVGAVIALSRPLAPLMVGTQALGGLIGGLLGILGKIGSAVGVMIGGIALLLPLENSAELTKSILEMLIASLAFLVLRLPQRFLRLFSPARVDAQRGAPKLQETVAVRLHEFARVLRELSKSYTQVAAAAVADKDLVVHVERLVRKVCEDCSQCSRCWDGGFFRRYSTMSDLVSLAEAKPGLVLQDAPLELRQICPRTQELVIAATCIADLRKAQRVWTARTAEMKTVLAAQIKGISSVVDGLASEVRTMPATTQSRKRELDYEISIARRAKQGSIICGDSILHKESKDGKLVLILSDGMGSGSSAALESKATVALLEQLVENGFEPDLAVETVNSFMGLKFPDDTFATVDLAIIDLVTGEAEFTKRSAAPSFVKREAEVTVLTTSSLPIGILGQAEADRTHKVIRNGDMLVMVTDGALQWVKAPRKDEPYANYLARLKLQHADEVSGRLLDKVLEAGKDSLGDDVTIVVVRFLAASPERV